MGRLFFADALKGIVFRNEDKITIPLKVVLIAPPISKNLLLYLEGKRSKRQRKLQ